MQLNDKNKAFSTEFDEFLEPEEAAKLLKVTREELMTAVCDGLLPGVCLDNKWRFSLKALSKFAQTNFCFQFVLSGKDDRNPYRLGDMVQQKVLEVIDLYNTGQRYFPDLNIEGGLFNQLDLPEIDLWSSNLKGADFSKSNLRSASFVGANLESAVFEESDLTDVDFNRASINHANFKGAYLNRTILHVKSMHGADFTGATINRARF